MAKLCSIAQMLGSMTGISLGLADFKVIDPLEVGVKHIITKEILR